jgi:5'-3' exonuclease
LPILKIRKVTIGVLIYLYKKLDLKCKKIYKWKRQLNLENYEILFKKLSLIEDEFFKHEVINKISIRIIENQNVFKEYQLKKTLKTNFYEKKKQQQHINRKWWGNGGCVDKLSSSYFTTSNLINLIVIYQELEFVGLEKKFFCLQKKQ